MAVRVRLLPKKMADRVDGEGEVLIDDQAQEAAHKQPSPGVAPQRGQRRWHEQTYQDGQRQVHAVLEANKPVTPEIRSLLARGVPEEKPKDVCVPETLLDAIGISVSVDVSVVLAMIEAPLEGRALKTGAAEKEQEENARATPLRSYDGRRGGGIRP